jgi:hypothetical protein
MHEHIVRAGTPELVVVDVSQLYSFAYQQAINPA